MARYTESVCRLCRREGVKLFLKGERCYSAKCAVTKRATPPGMHGKARARKLSEYGTQLREKQKLRRIYGMMEGQFASYYERAERMRGVTGENLLQLLERRLDNVVYRAGFCASRAQARQMINHGHFTINGKKVDIASYLVNVGEVIAVKENSTDVDMFKALREGNDTLLPKWLDFNPETLSSNILALPQREDLDMAIEEHLVVEYYSR